MSAEHYMAPLLLVLIPGFSKLVSAIHHFQHFTNPFPQYQLFRLKWWQNIFLQNRLSRPFQIKTRMSSTATLEQYQQIDTNFDPFSFHWTIL
jgi:hypothetical protein